MEVSRQIFNRKDTPLHIIFTCIPYIVSVLSSNIMELVKTEKRTERAMEGVSTKLLVMWGGGV
jgi:hypothetical protein